MAVAFRLESPVVIPVAGNSTTADSSCAPTVAEHRFPRALRPEPLVLPSVVVDPFVDQVWSVPTWDAVRCRGAGAVAWRAETGSSIPAITGLPGEVPVSVFEPPHASWWQRCRDWYVDAFPGVTPAAWRCLRQLDRISLVFRLLAIASLPVMTKVTLGMVDAGRGSGAFLLMGAVWLATTVGLLGLASLLESARAGLAFTLEAGGFSPAGVVRSCAKPRDVQAPVAPWT